MVSFKRLIFVFLTAYLVCGCHKPATEAPPTAAPLPPRFETIARAHWSGKEQLLKETNLTEFATLWELPQSSNLQAQTVLKLASAPWRFLSGSVSFTNAPSELLIPLVEDIINKESFCEIRHCTNEPGSVVIGVRAGNSRAGLWSTNLARVIESLRKTAPGFSNTNLDWRTRADEIPFCEFLTQGDWVFFELSYSSNRFCSELAKSISAGDNAWQSPTNQMLAAEFDLPRVSKALNLNWVIPTNCPRIAMEASTRSNSVRSVIKMSFSQRLPLEIKAWQIPTNIIHDPLVSFTAAQGIAPMLGMFGKRLLLPDSALDQIFFWAQDGVPFLSFFATPSPNSSNIVRALGEKLETKANPWMTNNGIGFFKSGSNSVVWLDLLMISPFIRSLNLDGTSYVFGGMINLASTNRPMPLDLQTQVMANKQLVFYDWEITGPRLAQWMNFSQLTRFALGKAQISTESAGYKWLKSLEDLLGNTATAITKEDDATLILIRNSSLGLNAPELTLLCDWLEGPNFPFGLNTFDTQPETSAGAKKKIKR